LADAGSGDVLGDSLDDSPSMVFVGIVMGLGASVAINIGQNLQALGLQGPGGDKAKQNPCLSSMWVAGMTIFIVGSMVNFAAFSFASSSILVPLEAVQLVVNVAFNKFVNNAPVSCRMLAGVALAVVGTALAVLFGPNDERCFTLSEMEGFWARPLWWIYLVATTAFALLCFAVHARYRRAQREGRPLPRSQYVLPVTYALSSALVGGAQMIVHSKAIAELFEVMALKLSDPALQEPLPPTTWYFYVEFSLLSVCGVIWLYRMNESLALFDPLFIIPLMQSSYILFGVVAGGIYYDEFGTLSHKVIFGVHLGVGGWFCFLGGLLAILAGMLLIAPPPQGSSDDDASRTSPRVTRIPSAYMGAYTDAFLAAVFEEADPESLPITRETTPRNAAGRSAPYCVSGEYREGLSDAYRASTDGELSRQPSAYTSAYANTFGERRTSTLASSASTDVHLQT